VQVAVALSGGADSTAAALMLQRDGHDVSALTMLLGGPSADATVGRATRVAQTLGIEHHVVDLSGEFEREVVRPFARSYAAGRTPNPCVLCNRRLKFGALFDKARALGADRMATGHYARLVSRNDGPPRLLEALDGRRDQSYFIACVSGSVFVHCLLPLGGALKSEVLRLVSEAGLDEATGPESRDICFIPGGDMRSFLERAAPDALVPGAIEDASGRVVGEHEGLGLYTVGQRTGLGLSRPRPTYVLAIDAARNALVVGDEEDLDANGLAASGLTWVGGEAPRSPLACGVRIRSASVRIPSRVEISGASADVAFERPARAVAPGQTVVLSVGDEILGCGTIERARRNGG